MLYRTSFLKKYRDDREANTAIMFALTLPLIVGAAGIGVETGYWYFKDRELQTAADVASYAAAVEKRGGATNSVVDSTALNEAVEHGFVSATGSITVNHPPTSGTHQDESSVEVVLTMPAERFFSAIYSTNEVTLHARGVATFSSGGDACILALDPTASGAVTFTGNALTMINGCNVMSNSLANDALIVTGSADVTVPCVLAAGGVSVDDGLTLTTCSEPQANVPPATDPYKDETPPDVSGSCLALPSSNAAATLSPGRYCGGGNLKGTKTFNPGVYIMDGGTFRINASANVSGSGVTFYLTNGATVDFNGTADITLSAPTSGAYKGILFWANKDDPNNSNKFNGTASSHLTGALYFPNQDVQFLGNFSGVNGCLRVVARTMKFTGSTTMNSNCTAAGLDSITLPGRVTLVE
ncbi:MAG: pilus assembly protein TadG-related protein [Micropepsaceae bacterium]